MVSYHVYVPLLLRLANDVEENPGPVNIYNIVDHSFTVPADFNQGNISMFGINAGKQCVAMSIYAIVYNEIKSVNIWDTPLMNMLLINANNLYAIISQHIQKDFLLLTDVPEILSINNDTFNLEYSDSFSGALWMDQGNEPYVTLEHAFHEVFDAGNYKACLLTIQANTVAVLMPFPDVFKVFDSHSRDMHGMPAAMVNEQINTTSNNHEKCSQKRQSETITIRKSNQRTKQQEKENRLAKQREKRQQESVAERENRLAKRREKRQESVAERETRLQHQRETKRLKRQNETVEQRKQRLAKARLNYKANKRRCSGKNKSCPPSGSQEHHSNDNSVSHNSVSQLIHKFHKSVSTGPLYICLCCDQLWYKHSVCPAERLRLSNPNSTKHLQGIKSVNDIEWLCLTCDKHLKKNKVPPSAISNGLKFPEKPHFFDLNELECRLIAPRLAFQKIMQAPRGGQLKITGNVVNVPADICNTVNMLPRLPQDTGTIKVQLKRRLQYKSSALSLNVRPNKVMQAAAWLVNTSELYQEQGITFDQHWLSYFDVTIPNSDNENTTVDQTNSTSEDEWSEDEAEIPAGVTDSMLTPTDFVDDTERQHIYNVAPGEGSRPLSIFRDQYSEELAYPGIFLGQRRPDEKQRLTRVYYSEICKSELRRSDRRAAMCIENIFFKTKKMQMKLLLGQSQLAIRKCKMGNRTLTTGELKTPEGLTNLICHDEGYKFLRALRGSPPYFEKAKKDLFAMIRQLGPASLFCSFSSAETKWNHLLRILGKLVDHKDYSDEELDHLNWDEKCRLIQSDPVTCARHFDYQFNAFLKDFLMSEIAPLGKLKDWFYRVEYQQRGSPHIHMLIWLENAPVFGVDKDEDVVNFIDQIITCRKPDNDTELFDLVNRQTHRHSHTCRKNSKKVCRFNYPQPPMRSTQILHPLDDNASETVIRTRKELWKNIKNKLNDLKVPMN
ncbi:ATP-dependent DNA helicase PIF1 [Paramuricea clavata]|uniref:ATP-dependent DNA helicase PIF1 n=1 Tax=Paramuricea clavata TaxID=317549 RepID=A0A6S7HPM3_PARCT|nr:ATP-dependent DNA helicase PIF1 [Paramuricea clavata]